MTWIPHPLAASERARPNQTAVTIDEQDYSYRELKNRVALRAKALVDNGIKSGDVVILADPLSVDWVVNFHAIGWCDACVAPLDHRLTDEEFSKAVATIQPDHIMWRDVDSRLATADDSTDMLPEPQWELEAARLIVLTSGSTGLPKPVEISGRQLVFSAMGSAIRLGHQIDDRWLMCLPVHHIAGISILFRCAWYGTAVEVLHPFDAGSVAAKLDSGVITLVSLVPTMLRQTLAARAQVRFPDRLRVILVGGAPCPRALVARCEAIGAPLSLTWGMTETCAQVCTQFPGEYGLANDAGPPLPFAIVHDVDGQLTVDGPVVQSPLKTQDLGRLLEGRVQISGRADSIINSGGKKIMPAEIEAVLDRHPQIHEAVVMGIDDTHWGQRVVACYVADTEGEAPSNGELDRWCRQSLSDYKIPKVWRQCAELPRNQMGKIDRVKLGSLFRDAQSGSPKAVHKGLGSGRRPEIGKMDEGVLLTDHTAVGPVIEASDDTAEGDGALRQSVDDHLGNQSVSTPHGPMKGSVSMDQGQADANLVEDSIEITESGGHHLLETDMRVLESSSIEHDAGTVDFVETGSDLKLERHNHPLNGRRTQGR